MERPAYPAELAQGLGLTRSNVSNHLACLRDCGIVVAAPQGRQTRYEIADAQLAQALTALVEVALAIDEDAPCLDSGCSVPGVLTRVGPVILSSVVQAIGLFIATNIDDVIVVSLFFARGAGQRGTTARIAAGQYRDSQASSA